MSRDADSLVAAACAQAGLKDFDSESYREGLEIVAANLTRSRDLTDMGRETVKGIAIRFLANRLRIADYARRNPSIHQRPIERPVVIFGVPRTGTTMLSHLLDLDPHHRSLLHWEAFDSVPPATDVTLRSDPRCLAMKAVDDSQLSTPSEIHVLQADLPTECIIPQAHDFKSILWYGIAEDPAYTRWFLDCDMTSAYAFHKLQLQVLQSHTRGRWVTKAPAHSLALGALLETYPDARLVWTHRDPYKALASACNFIASTRSAFAHVDEQALGASFLELFRQHLMRPMAHDAAAGGDSIYHLHYATLMRDPIAEIRRLYAWLGDAFSPEVEQAMREWLLRNRKGQFARPAYRLEQYGLSVEVLRPHFKDYVDRYQVAVSDA